MAKGTDIYIISGTEQSRGKHAPAEELVMLSFSDGRKALLPLSLFNYLSARYAINGLNRIGATITADSIPDYDEWLPDDYWTCTQWVLWHQLNVTKYGLQIANQKFIDAWEQQDDFMSPMIWCKYDASFINYFKAQGIEGGWLLSNAVVAVTNVADSAGEVVTNTAGAASSLSSGVKSVANVAKYAAPFLAVGAIVWGVDKYVYPIFPKRKAA